MIVGCMQFIGRASLPETWLRMNEKRSLTSYGLRFPI